MTGFKSKKAMSGDRIMKPNDISRMFKLKETIPKYKFSRDWYIAEFRDEDYNEVREWCKEQFGPEPRFPDAWSRWQHRYEHQIFLRDAKDYHWFMLRWGV